MLQTIQIALQILLNLHEVNSTSLFTIIKPAKDAFNSSTQIIDKNVKGPRSNPWGRPLMTGHQKPQSQQLFELCSSASLSPSVA